MDQVVLLLANLLWYKMIRILPQYTSKEIVAISALKSRASAFVSVEIKCKLFLFIGSLLIQITIQ